MPVMSLPFDGQKCKNDVKIFHGQAILFIFWLDCEWLLFFIISLSLCQTFSATLRAESTDMSSYKSEYCRIYKIRNSLFTIEISRKTDEILF